MDRDGDRPRVVPHPPCPGALALLGAVLPGHPFDVLYHYLLRRRIGGAPLPRYPRPRRFACLLASLWLLATAGAFASGHVFLGAALGWSLVAAAFVNVTTGFCVPSFLHNLLFGSPRCPEQTTPQKEMTL